MNKGVHRVAAGTKSARRLMARSEKNIVPWIPDALKTTQQREIEAWNAEIDRKKAAKSIK